MGLYDREYVRRDRPRFFLGAHRSMIANVMIITIGVYLLQLLFANPNGFDLTQWLEMPSALFSRRYWSELWTLLTTQPFSEDTLYYVTRLASPLTYGFGHDPHRLIHIAGNMFMFWMFGREVELVYNRNRFLWFYLTAIITAALGWGFVQTFRHTPASIIGASGGVSAVCMLYVFNFPDRVLYIYGILPVPAWVLGIVWLVFDMYGHMGGGRVPDNVAYSAHLFGAAYGAFYFKYHWSFGELLPRPRRRGSEPSFWGKLLSRKPKLRVHEPDEPPATGDERDFAAQVDEILRKFHEHGQDSLTPAERHTLEEASRRAQRRQR